MGKNYYCEYCNKRFKDDLNIRKKHINGINHQTAQKQHYAKYKGNQKPNRMFVGFSFSDRVFFKFQLQKKSWKRNQRKNLVRGFKAVTVNLEHRVVSVTTHQNK